MFIVIMAVTLIMAKYYEERKVHHAWITGAIIYEITILMNQLTNLIQSGTFQKIIELLVLTIMAAICGTIVWHWFKTDEIEPDPRKILNL